MKRNILTLVTVVATFLSSSVFAQAVYKWTDAKGTVNYGSVAPKGVQTSRLDQQESRLTVIPLGQFQRSVAEDSSAIDSKRLEARVDDLEQQVERERRAGAALAQRSQDQLTSLRQRCRDERWVDCDDNRALFSRYGSAFSGQVYGYGSHYGGGVIFAPPAVRVRPGQPITSPQPSEPSRPPALVRPLGRPA